MSRLPEQPRRRPIAPLAVTLIGLPLLAATAAAQTAAQTPTPAVAPGGAVAPASAAAGASAVASPPAAATPSGAGAPPTAGTPAAPAAATSGSPAGPQSRACHTIGPICYTASKGSFERNRVVLDDIDAVADTVRGLVRLHADRAQASGPNLAASQWLFSGHVQVRMPQVQLQADGASVQFADKGVASVTATGAPAQFQGLAPSGPAHPGAGAGAAGAVGGAGTESAGTAWHGHANTIVYDAVNDRLQLDGASWVSNGCEDLSGARISYDIARQSMVATSGPGERVQSTIRPHTNGCAPGNSP